MSASNARASSKATIQAERPVTSAIGGRRRFNVHLIEDTLDDQQLALRALRSCELQIDVRLSRDGVEALQLLGIESQTESMFPDPDLIICDLKMPRVRGDEVLQKLRQDPRLAEVPFVMFSSSAHDSDIRRAMELGANDYCVKPLDFGAYISCVQDIARRWLALEDVEPNCLVESAQEPA